MQSAVCGLQSTNVIHRTMLGVGILHTFALSASFVFECFDCSEVTTRKGNESIVQKENCFVEEIRSCIEISLWEIYL